MSAITPCTPCCATPQTVNIPGGQGSTGNNGTNGRNAFTLTTADFVVPNAVNGTVAIQVGDTSWLVVGQTVIIGQGLGGALLFPGPATFKVDSITSLTGFVGKWLQYSGDVAANTTIGSGTGSGGAVVTTSGGTFTTPLPIAAGGTNATTVAQALNNLGLMSTGLVVPISVYGTGTIGATAYVMTANAVNDPTTQINVNGTAIEITITTAGTWLLMARCRVDYNGASFVAPRTMTGKMRRTNNTPADVANSTSQIVTPILTTETFTQGDLELEHVIYTTANTNDVIALLARIGTLPSAGTVEIGEASILAIKLY